MIETVRLSGLTAFVTKKAEQMTGLGDSLSKDMAMYGRFMADSVTKKFYSAPAGSDPARNSSFRRISGKNIKWRAFMSSPPRVGRKRAEHTLVLEGEAKNGRALAFDGTETMKAKSDFGMAVPTRLTKMRYPSLRYTGKGDKYRVIRFKDPEGNLRGLVVRRGAKRPKKGGRWSANDVMFLLLGEVRMRSLPGRGIESVSGHAMEKASEYAARITSRITERTGAAVPVKAR